MTKCINCAYFLSYKEGGYSCLMKHDFCIVGGETVYPRDCNDFKDDTLERVQLEEDTGW